MTISLKGTVNGLATTDTEREELFLKVFHEVISAFYIKSDIWDFIEKQSGIKTQKTAQFIKTGRFDDTDVETHALGADYNTVDLNQNEITIHMDSRPIATSIKTDEQDDFLSQYDKTTQIKDQIVNAFALSMDKRAYCKVGEASTTVNPVATLEDGEKVINANFGVTADATLDVLDYVSSAAETRGVMVSDLRVVVTPVQFRKLRRLLKDDLINKDYADRAVGFDRGTDKMYYGDLEILSSAHFSKIQGTNVLNVNGNTDYAFDFTNTLALCFSKETVAALIAEEVSIKETDLSAVNGLTYTAWTMRTGMGVLTPETAFNIASI
jgi:hypothetical protein